MEKVTILRKMIESAPTNGELWYLLGLEYLEQSAPVEALQAFSEALKYSTAELQSQIFQHLASLSTGTTCQSTPTTDSATPELDHASDEPEDMEEDLPELAGAPPFKVITGGKSQVSSLPKPVDNAVTFADVGGLDELKETIRMKIINPFFNQGLFARFKKKVGGGILLYGPPGCGKSFMARATAGECQAKFITVHISDILDPYIGVSEQNIHNIFTTARAHKPCVLFFDEIDALGYNRAKLSSHHLRPAIDQLLSEIDGIDTDTNQLLIIAATNMPWDVDPAFKRPGRFDRMVFVAPPDDEAREIIFGLKLADKPVDALDLKQLARKTEFFSGADIESVIETAVEHVLAEIMRTGVERPLMMKDLLQAITSTRPSTLEWLRTIKNYVKYANQDGLYDDIEKYLSRHKKML